MFDELTNKHLSKLRDDIALVMNSKDMIVTGEAVGSLEVQGNKLVGSSYIMQLANGRLPGKFPPVQNIRDWVRRKLGVKENKVNGIAYFVGLKIANEGTRAYTNKNYAIPLDEMVDKMIDELTAELPDAMEAYAKKFGVGRK